MAIDETGKVPNLTPEQETALKEIQEYQTKVNETSKVIGDKLKELGLTIEIVHQIKFIPVQKRD